MRNWAQMRCCHMLKILTEINIIKGQLQQSITCNEADCNHKCPQDGQGISLTQVYLEFLWASLNSSEHILFAVKHSSRPLKLQPLLASDFAYTPLWRQIPIHNLNVPALFDGAVDWVDQHLTLLQVWQIF